MCMHLAGGHDQIIVGGKALSIPDAAGPVVHVEAQAAVQLGPGFIQPLPHQ